MSYKIQCHSNVDGTWFDSFNEGLHEKEFKTLLDANYAIAKHASSGMEYKAVFIAKDPEDKLCDKLARIAALNVRIREIIEEE